MAASIRDGENIIGKNIRRLRKERGFGQTALVREVSLRGVSLTRETLVKLEGGRQHIKLDQLTAIKDVLSVGYDDLLSG